MLAATSIPNGFLQAVRWHVGNSWKLPIFALAASIFMHPLCQESILNAWTLRLVRVFVHETEKTRHICQGCSPKASWIEDDWSMKSQTELAQSARNANFILNKNPENLRRSYLKDFQLESCFAKKKRQSTTTAFCFLTSFNPGCTGVTISQYPSEDHGPSARCWRLTIVKHLSKHPINI